MCYFYWSNFFFLWDKRTVVLEMLGSIWWRFINWYFFGIWPPWFWKFCIFCIKHIPFGCMHPLLIMNFLFCAGICSTTREQSFKVDTTRARASACSTAGNILPLMDHINIFRLNHRFNAWAFRTMSNRSLNFKKCLIGSKIFKFISYRSLTYSTFFGFHICIRHKIKRLWSY